jgi:cytochrome c peroxidase
VNGAAFLTGSLVYANAAFDSRLEQLDLARAITIHQRPGALSESAEVLQSWQVSDSPLPEEVRLGRELFYSATDPGMTAGGISCSTCHFEGRSSGVTFNTDEGPRHVPSLAGVVSETVPVTWSSDVQSVGDEAEITVLGRLGGSGVSPEQLGQIESFVDWTRLPDVPDVDPDAVARGELLFLDAGCSTCHSGSRFTDNEMHVVRNVSLNTPTLSGIAGSAPYLHDGSARTLREVLELSNTGDMGYTGGFADNELDDLEAYLRSL